MIIYFLQNLFLNSIVLLRMIHVEMKCCCVLKKEKITEGYILLITNYSMKMKVGLSQK